MTKDRSGKEWEEGFEAEHNDKCPYDDTLETEKKSRWLSGQSDKFLWMLGQKFYKTNNHI